MKRIASFLSALSIQRMIALPLPDACTHLPFSFQKQLTPHLEL